MTFLPCYIGPQAVRLKALHAFAVLELWIFKFVFLYILSMELAVVKLFPISQYPTVVGADCIEPYHMADSRRTFPPNHRSNVDAGARGSTNRTRNISSRSILASGANI